MSHVRLYRLNEMAAKSILPPGHYMIQRGHADALSVRLYHPTSLHELADMVEAMERDMAA